VIAAAGALLRLHESRRKLLGLDAPTKVDAQVRAEVYSPDALDAELLRPSRSWPSCRCPPTSSSSRPPPPSP
jgi:hypothetical protein